MTLNDILAELLKLDKADKFRVIEILSQDVDAKDYPEFGQDYGAWSPHDSVGAAEKLLKMLEQGGIER